MLALCRWFLIAIHLAGPAVAKDSLEHIRDQLMEVTEWSELCALTDCSQFPVGYHTYIFGKQVYYFPTASTMTVKPPSFTGRLKPARTMELGPDGLVRRSFGYSRGTIVADCCHYLLVFYDLADDFPQFRDVDGRRMPSAWTTFAPSNEPHRDNKAFRYFDVPSDALPNLDTLISKNQVSFNTDFWLTKFSDPDETGDQAFHIISKRPLLNGYHVLGRCGLQGCGLNTLALTDTESETRPHVSLRHMTLTPRDEYLCLSEELENKCNPASEVFDKVMVMLGKIEDMFEAASVHPSE